MKYNDLTTHISHLSCNFEFSDAAEQLEECLFNLNKSDLIEIVNEIGSIPECIEHYSREEKLYTKASDIILAKCFMELGLEAYVIKERSDCADVVAKSKHHGYSLVADAKAFRLSRTAKNQKDFKVESMVHWRRDNDYSVLCCPYFQYPKSKSQIYASAIAGNVTLFSWEYFSMLLSENIIETDCNNLSKLWTYNKSCSVSTSAVDMKQCFLKEQTKEIQKLLNYTDEQINEIFDNYKVMIAQRAQKEIVYRNEKIDEIKKYSREKAVNALIKSLKLNKKIDSINSYISQLEK